MENNIKNKYIDQLNNKPSYQELFQLLQEGDFDEKHFAITCIEELEKPEDIGFLINNLVDQDTKIRETSSFKICDFVLNNHALMEFLDKNHEIILRTANDVNPQVCRNIMNLLKLSQKKDFFAKKFLQKAQECLNETRSIRAKTHKVNKTVFNLYWNLYGIENIIDNDFQNINLLKEVLEETSMYKDYTIRERAAFITKKLNEHGFQVEGMVEKFKNDKNFYVRNVF